MFQITGIKSIIKGIGGVFIGKPAPGYEKEYREKAKRLDVMLSGYGGKIKGYMSGKSPKEVVEYFERLKSVPAAENRRFFR